MVKLIKKDKKKKGFTLIELVAVVAIIGILAAILVPKIAGYMNEAKKTKVIDQGRKVLLAVETFNMKNDSTNQINTTTATVATAIGKESVRNFIDPNAADAAALTNTGGALDKIPSTTTLVKLKQIVEDRKDFKLGTNDELGNIVTG